MRLKKSIWITKATKEALREYAYQHRTTMGELAGGFLADYAAGLPGVEVPKDAHYWSEPRTKLKFVATEEDWAAAQARAKAEGTDVPKYMRARVDAEL